MVIAIGLAFVAAEMPPAPANRGTTVTVVAVLFVTARTWPDSHPDVILSHRERGHVEALSVVDHDCDVSVMIRALGVNEFASTCGELP